MELLQVYLNQTGEQAEYLSLNFPGIYNIFYENSNGYIINPNNIISYIGIIILAIIFMAFAILVFVKHIEFSKKQLLEFAVWSIIICVYLLPKMHDRYMFSADVLTVIIAFIDKDKKYLAIGVNLASAFSYEYWHGKVALDVLAIMLGIILIKYTYEIFKELLKGEKIEKDISDSTNVL